MIDYINQLKTNKLVHDIAVSRIIRFIKFYSNDYKCFEKYVYDQIGTSAQNSLEIHFYPLKLADIVDILMRKSINEEQYFLEFKIIYLFMEQLRNNNICYCLIPIETHKEIHLNELPYTPDKVYGHLDKFIENYGDYFTDEQTNKCKQLLERGKQDDINRTGN